MGEGLHQHWWLHMGWFGIFHLLQSFIVLYSFLRLLLFRKSRQWREYGVSLEKWQWGKIPVRILLESRVEQAQEGIIPTSIFYDVGDSSPKTDDTAKWRFNYKDSVWNIDVHFSGWFVLTDQMWGKYSSVIMPGTQAIQLLISKCVPWMRFEQISDLENRQRWAAVWFEMKIASSLTITLFPIVGPLGHTILVPLIKHN